MQRDVKLNCEVSLKKIEKIATLIIDNNFILLHAVNITFSFDISELIPLCDIF